MEVGVIGGSVRGRWSVLDGLCWKKRAVACATGLQGLRCLLKAWNMDHSSENGEPLPVLSEEPGKFKPALPFPVTVSAVSTG